MSPKAQKAKFEMNPRTSKLFLLDSFGLEMNEKYPVALH